MRHIPIRWKLPLLACGLPVIIAAATLWEAYVEVRRSSIEVAEQRMGGVLSSLVSRAEGQFRLAERRGREVASRPALARYLSDPGHANQAAARAALADLQPSGGSTVRLDLIDQAGVPLPLDTLSGFPVPRIPEPELVRLTNGPERAGIGAIRSHESALLYPLVAAVADAGSLQGFLVLWQRLVPGAGEMALLAQLAGPESDLYIGSLAGPWTVDGEVRERPGFDPLRLDSLQRYTRNGSDQRMAVAVGVAGSDWLVALEAPASAVMAPARRFLGRMSTAALIVGALGLTAGLVVSKQITRPLGELSAAAEQMSGGGHQVRVAIHGDDEPGRLAAAFNHMAERVDDEVEARARSEAQWRLLFAGNPQSMWVYDRESLQFLAVNEAAVASYGFSREEFLAMTIEQIRPPEEVAALRVRMAGAPPEEARVETVRHRRKDGRDLDVEVVGRPVTFDGRPAWLVLAEDITDRLVLEASLRQAQKMEAVGRLAGGIAHDFNNLLAVIMTYTELASEDLASDDPRAVDLQQVRDAADRAHTLTRQLLAFSRHQVIQPTVFDPNQAVSSVEQLLRRLLGEDIRLEFQLDPEIGRVRIDLGQFEQVLLNLAVNARDAMPEGGSLRITTAPAEVNESSMALHGLSRPGRFAVISVSDSGEGMSADTRARIFEPFFTTKEVGKGTGLGLATVYAIVNQAEGNITVYSEVGMGATFRIYLPSVEDAPAEAAAPATVDPAIGGSETILLVEDDPAVRKAAEAALVRLGYTVLSAPDAASALALLGRHAGAIRLIVSDVVMPGSDGPWLVAEVRRSHPAVKALLMSGYTGDLIARRGAIDPGVAFLEKPFTAGILARKVREVLEGG